MDVIGLLLLLLTGWVIGLALITVHTIRTLTHPPRRGYAYALARSLPSDPAEVSIPLESGSPRPLTFESWTFKSRSLELAVWDIPGLDPLGPTIIFTHGWGDSRVTSLARLPTLAGSSRRVIMWDLPGHGESPGTCTLGTREVRDLLALIEAITRSNSSKQHPDASEGERGIVLHGFSLGAGISIAAAAEIADGARHPIHSVIAEAPYRVPATPARNVMRLWKLPRLLNLPLAMAWIGARLGFGLSWANRGPAGGFDRAEFAARVRIPLLVLHGTADAVCPLEDGRAIAKAAPSGTVTEIEGGGHIDLWTDPRFRESCDAGVRAFIAQSNLLPRASEGGVTRLCE